ncbi:MAG: hypothetical protein JNL43_03680 [Flavobacteriales bacterium]|nr:hypothetical protein [Flavobacteriales bacterium]
MRHTLTLALLAVSAQFVRAQQCDWLTSASIDYDLNPTLPSEVIASAPGRLVIARNTTGYFIYDQHVYGNAMVEALGLDGLPYWSCGLFDSVHVESAVVSGDGRAFFAGSFMGDMQLCDGSVLGGVPGQSTFYENMFLLAVDLSEGTILWSRNLSFVHDQAIEIPSMAFDPQGRLWYAVSEWGIGKVVRVDGNGADVETRLVDGPRTIGTISFDPAGGLYMSGGCDNNGFAFGGQAYQDYGDTGYSMFLLRYKPDGTAGFAAFADDITFQDPCVVAATDGHAYLAGGIFDATQWGDVQLHGPNWSQEVFIVRVDSLGEFLWGVESAPAEPEPITGNFMRSSGPCIALDPDDRLYLIGDARGTTDWGNGVITGSSVITDHVLAVVAFSDEGTALWSADSEVSAGWSEARNITASAEPGSVHFAAHIRDPFEFGDHSTGDVGVQAAAFAELSGITTALRPVANERSAEAWPVPSRSVVHVGHTGAKTTADLINSAGEQVRTLPLLPGRNTIDMSYLPAGLYFLRTAEGDVMRLVKE